MDDSSKDHKDASSQGPDKRRKKRLSRREQKARKKRKAATTDSEKKDKPDNHRAVTAQSDDQVVDFEATYVPTPRPSGPHKSQQQKPHAKSLGKWFPKAVVLKALAPPSPQRQASIVLFYQYVNPLWPESFLSGFISYLCQIAEHRCLGGRIRVAREGVNATLSSCDTESASAKATLRYFALDLQGYHDIFRQTDFKYIDNLSGDRHFKDFKVFPVQELVFYGLPSDKTVGENSTSQMDLGSMPGGVHLSAQDFHQKLTDPNTVVVDVRNHYEAMLGRFDGQEQNSLSNDNPDKHRNASPSKASTDTTDVAKSANETQDDERDNQKPGSAATTAAAAEYIDPRMRKSTDWTRWLEQDETKKKLEGKQVLLYCTGGIRCERASVYLNHKMGDKVKGIYQLQGGIERYFKAFPDGGHWRGKNFVFDKRSAVDVHNHDGDGGVITNEKKSEKPAVPDAKCVRCASPWDRYVGKKKCNTCGVPVLVCDVCLSQIGSRKEEETKLRCPLCVEENVTIAAKDVEFTENGMAGKAHTTGHAAPSVLKWGGGHAALKKDKRRFQRKPCRFGADCKRKDCFFSHPTTGDSSKESASA